MGMTTLESSVTCAAEERRTMWTDTIKNIFVPFSPAETAITTAAVDVAVSMADQAAAHLTIRALRIKQVPPYSVMPQFVGALAAKVNEDELESLQTIGQHLEAMLKTVAFPHDMMIAHQPYAALVEMAAHQGRRHDISVIDAPHEYMTFQQAVFEELVFQTGRPVLVVPAGVATFTAKRIVIAWDG
jgi:protoheme ferro-lyase